MEEYQKLTIVSTGGTGTNINNLSFDLAFIKELKKNFDVELGFDSFHINNISLNIEEGANNLKFEEDRIGVSILGATAIITPGFYTVDDLYAELKAKMDLVSPWGMKYFWSSDALGRPVCTDNKPIGTHIFRFLQDGATSVLPDIGFEDEDGVFGDPQVGDFIITSILDNKILRCDTNLIKSQNYDTILNSSTNTLFDNVKFSTQGGTVDSIDFYNQNIIYYPSNLSNRSNFRVKFVYATDPTTPFPFRGNSTYCLVLVYRTKMKQSVLEKLKYVNMKDIKDIVGRLLELELRKVQEKEEKEANKKGTVLKLKPNNKKKTTAVVKEVLDKKAKKVKK